MKASIWISLTLVIVILVSVVTACGVEEDAIAVPEGAQAGDLHMYPGIYKAGDVEYTADRGTLVVTENRNDPDSRLIALPVVRVRSLGNDPAEPIFYLSGGPGESNMGFSRVEGLIDDHDIVLVGYRGVDGSVVLDGPEISEHIKNLPGDMLGDAALKNMATAYSQCAQRLQNEGIDTNGYSVIEMIDDIETTRSALGYDQLNLLSASYGTRLAMIYAWKYPSNVHRSAMISVNPPGHFVYEPEIVDEQLKYYAALFAEDPEYGSRVDDLAQMMREVSHNMPDRWLLFPLNAGMIKMATFESLANTSEAAKVFDIWLAAAEGDYSGMALLTLAGPMMFAEATIWGDNAAKAVSIGDYDFSSRDYATEMNPLDSIIGSPRSIMADAWTGWPTYRIPEEYSQVQPSDVETLLISGSIDFLCPAEFATDELLPALSNGQQVILSEFGHTGDVWTLQPEATRHLLTNFFTTGEVDSSLYTYHTVNFNAGLGGFPTMAKITAVVVVLVIAGLGVLVWFNVRKIRRRRAHQAA